MKKKRKQNLEKLVVKKNLKIKRGDLKTVGNEQGDSKMMIMMLMITITIITTIIITIKKNNLNKRERKNKTWQLFEEFEK